MRYFPQRARMKTSMSAKLSVCTHCLGDLFADGRCVQCHAKNRFRQRTAASAIAGHGRTECARQACPQLDRSPPGRALTSPDPLARHAGRGVREQSIFPALASSLV